MSELKVNSIKGVGASAAAITVDNTSGSASANLTAVNSVVMPNGGFLSNRNLIINGAMQVAQRGTSSTSNSYATVDRMSLGEGGLDETCTQAQVDVASGTSPYTSGFRKAYKITNGNQTGGAGTTDFIRFEYRIEAQDIANSGWNYTDSNSKISIQFWVKSSVAQNFYFLVNSVDGTARSFPMETGSLSADTWTKVTKTISGDSVLTFNNDNGEGLVIFFYLYLGTSYANNSVSLNTWKNVANPQVPTNTTTWFTTNDATLEITGLQLEVGSVATDFEHRSIGQELLACQRYYYKETATYYAGMGYGTNASSNCLGVLQQPVVMRATPTATLGSPQYWGTGPSGGGQSASYSYVYGSTSVANGPRLTTGYELNAEL